MARGGRRPGAGRKPKLTKNETAIQYAEKQIRDQLPEILHEQIRLALGGFQIVDEKWLPAGLVTTGSGEAEMPAFPGKSAEELVLVERRVSTALPDRTAGQYLINRIMGTPVQRQKDEDAKDKISVLGSLILELEKERNLDDGGQTE